MFNILAESLFTASSRPIGGNPRPAEKRILGKGRRTTAPTAIHRTVSSGENR
ncbi:hypothetical protein [Salibaculum sp.]|uniref:hypothetical protein n=1 Tax=Salibaculum sp. TaxID=2855480 RepID=UPI002B491C75|nr:hypothetical protein [Salibaculum sp.]HKL69118.1 hypothetical protein [Salibaculum sp.]